MKQKCSICKKKFTRLTSLRRHRAICELLNQSELCQKADLEEISDLPPLIELWSVVKTLVQENIKLKKDMEKIKNWVHTKKKKINIINWLNENKKPVLTFQKWKLKINIYDSDLNLIFDNGFITGIVYILERNLILTEELPIRAFQQKSNCLYIFEDKGWRILKTDEFKELISYVNKNLLIYFKKWYNKNIKLINDPTNDDTYQKNIIKIMGGRVPYDQRIKKINSKLFKYLNINIKNIIQFEFNF